MKRLIAMTNISQIQYFILYELNIKYYSVKLYSKGYFISFVCRKYKNQSLILYAEIKKFDGTKELLSDKSHKLVSKYLNVYIDI